ncbi:HAD family hydrolase [Acidobacteriota bacterium]
MNKIYAVGFDFDDTLILSEREKSGIYEEIFFRKYGCKKGVKEAYNRLRGKANRTEKIKYIVNQLLEKEPEENEVEELSGMFSREYESKLSHCPLVQCANILKELKKQVKFMFLLSLENKKEVEDVAAHCGVAQYFDEILGGPASKIENFKHVCDKHHINPEEIVYIGDSEGDVIKSKKLNIKAVGIQRDFSYRELLKKLGADFTFSSLCDVPYKHLTHEHLYVK